MISFREKRTDYLTGFILAILTGTKYPIDQNDIQEIFLKIFW